MRDCERPAAGKKKVNINQQAAIADSSCIEPDELVQKADNVNGKI